MEKDLIEDLFSFKKQLEASHKNLLNLFNEIKVLKDKNTENLKTSKNQNDIKYFLHVCGLYNELLVKVQDGLDSASLYLNFLKINLTYNRQLDKMSDEKEKLRESIMEHSINLLNNNRKYSKLGVLRAFCNEQTENTIYGLFLLEEFYLNKDKHESNLWNMAIGSNNQHYYIVLPNELLKIKWLCNQQKDDISHFKKDLESYCHHHAYNKRLLVNLCYVAYKFFECSNFHCSLYILNTLLRILREKKTDSKEKYYHYTLCKGLLLLKMNTDEEGMKIFMSGVKFLRNKLGSDFNKDILISIEYMSIGHVLMDYNYIELGSTILEMSLKCFENNLPQSYDLWLEATDVLGKCYNDTFNFTLALITLAPAYDYFHILNFGGIKAENKPIYELAMLMEDKSKLQKLTKQLKYPGYIPGNITLILSEMMLSFSGLGDQTSVQAIKTWIDRCEIMTRSNRKLIIDTYDFFGIVEVDKVIRKMKKNQNRHEELFNHKLMVETIESQESTILV